MRRLTYVPAFDGLRAIGVLGVFLFHTGHLTGGFLGVDLFFVLSGFLITSLLLDELALTRRIDLKAFWMRRVRRLAPALGLAVLATYLAVGLVYSFESSSAYGGDAITSVTFVNNWWSIRNQRGIVTPYVHTWSLAIELQFYLVWPLVVILANKIGQPSYGQLTRRVLWIALGGALLSAVVARILYTDPSSLARVYYGTDTHALPILAGCAGAAFLVERADRPTRLDRETVYTMAGLLCLFLVLAWLRVLPRDGSLYDLPGFNLYFALAALGLIVCLTGSNDWPLNRMLSFTPLRQLGLISYGVYIWHWPVVYLLPPDRLDIGDWPRTIIQAALTLAIATGSYLWIEKPIRERRWPFTRSTPRPAIA